MAYEDIYNPDTSRYGDASRQTPSQGAFTPLPISPTNAYYGGYMDKGDLQGSTSTLHEVTGTLKNVLGQISGAISTAVSSLRNAATSLLTPMGVPGNTSVSQPIMQPQISPELGRYMGSATFLQSASGALTGGRGSPYLLSGDYQQLMSESFAKRSTLLGGSVASVATEMGAGWLGSKMLGPLISKGILGTLGGGIAGYMGGGYVASHVMGRVNQGMEFDSLLKDTSSRLGINEGGPLSRGFSSYSRRNIAKELRGDGGLKKGDYADIMEYGSEYGMFSGVTNSEQFTDTVKSAAKQVKILMKVLREPDVRDVFKDMATFRQWGVPQGQMVSFAMHADAVGRATGQTAQGVMMDMAAGAQRAQQMGLLGRTGASLTASGKLMGRAMLKSGVVDKDEMSRATGGGGANEYGTQIAWLLNEQADTPTGRALLVAMSKKGEDGKYVVDEDIQKRYLSGKISSGEMVRIGGKKMSGDTALAKKALFDPKRLREEIVPDDEKWFAAISRSIEEDVSTMMRGNKRMSKEEASLRATDAKFGSAEAGEAIRNFEKAAPAQAEENRVAASVKRINEAREASRGKQGLSKVYGDANRYYRNVLSPLDIPAVDSRLHDYVVDPAIGVKNQIVDWATNIYDKGEGLNISQMPGPLPKGYTSSGTLSPEAEGRVGDVLFKTRARAGKAKTKEGKASVIANKIGDEIERLGGDEGNMDWRLGGVDYANLKKSPGETLRGMGAYEHLDAYMVAQQAVLGGGNVGKLSKDYSLTPDDTAKAKELYDALKKLLDQQEITVEKLIEHGKVVVGLSNDLEKTGVGQRGNAYNTKPGDYQGGAYPEDTLDPKSFGPYRKAVESYASASQKYLVDPLKVPGEYMAKGIDKAGDWLVKNTWLGGRGGSEDRAGKLVDEYLGHGSVNHDASYYRSAPENEVSALSLPKSSSATKFQTGKRDWSDAPTNAGGFGMKDHTTGASNTSPLGETVSDVEASIEKEGRMAIVKAGIEGFGSVPGGTTPQRGQAPLPAKSAAAPDSKSSDSSSVPSQDIVAKDSGGGRGATTGVDAAITGHDLWKTGSNVDNKESFAKKGMVEVAKDKWVSASMAQHYGYVPEELAPVPPDGMAVVKYPGVRQEGARPDEEALVPVPPDGMAVKVERRAAQQEGAKPGIAGVGVDAARGVSVPGGVGGLPGKQKSPGAELVGMGASRQLGAYVAALSGAKGGGDEDVEKVAEKYKLSPDDKQKAKELYGKLEEFKKQKRITEEAIIEQLAAMTKLYTDMSKAGAKKEAGSRGVGDIERKGAEGQGSGGAREPATSGHVKKGKELWKQEADGSQVRVIDVHGRSEKSKGRSKRIEGHGSGHATSPLGEKVSEVEAGAERLEGGHASKSDKSSSYAASLLGEEVSKVEHVASKNKASKGKDGRRIGGERLVKGKDGRHITSERPADHKGKAATRHESDAHATSPLGEKVSEVEAGAERLEGYGPVVEIKGQGGNGKGDDKTVVGKEGSDNKGLAAKSGEKPKDATPAGVAEPAHTDVVVGGDDSSARWREELKKYPMGSPEWQKAADMLNRGKSKLIKEDHSFSHVQKQTVSSKEDFAKKGMVEVAGDKGGKKFVGSGMARHYGLTASTSAAEKTGALSQFTSFDAWKSRWSGISYSDVNPAVVVGGGKTKTKGGSRLTPDTSHDSFETGSNVDSKESFAKKGMVEVAEGRWVSASMAQHYGKAPPPAGVPSHDVVAKDSGGGAGATTGADAATKALGTSQGGLANSAEKTAKTLDKVAKSAENFMGKFSNLLLGATRNSNNRDCY